MELLLGESLKERLDRPGSLSIAEVCALILPVISAVGAAHARGIVHRDLKPANIFLARTDEGPVCVKVLDFGIAKWSAQSSGSESGDLTQTGRMLGSPPYMSPEQAFCDKDIDHRTDIWSLGIVLYECLSGILPTRAENTGQVLKIIAKGGIRPLAQVAPQLPTEVASLIDRMLSEKPADRPSALSEVRSVLARYAAVETPLFGPPTEATAALEVGASDTRGPLAHTVGRGRGRARLRWMSAAALVSLSVIALMSWGLRDTQPSLPYRATGSGGTLPAMTYSTGPTPLQNEPSRAPDTGPSDAAPPDAVMAPTTPSATPRAPQLGRSKPEPTTVAPPATTAVSIVPTATGIVTANVPAEATAPIAASAAKPRNSSLVLDFDNPYQTPRPPAGSTGTGSAASGGGSSAH